MDMHNLVTVPKTCPVCRHTTDDNWVICPFCGWEESSCEHCGMPVPTHALICPVCGLLLDRVNDRPTGTPARRRLRR